MADDADHSLANALKRRERTAWSRAYDRYAEDVFVFIAHLLRGDRAIAEEVHQDVWLAALEGIDAFDAQRGELRGWIFGIARRKVALHFRRVGQARAPVGEMDGADGVRDESFLPADVITAVERSDAVRAALAELGADSRNALLGKYVSGLTVNELARRSGRSPKAIESLLSRARAQMRSLLAWYFDHERDVKDVKP